MQTARKLAIVGDVTPYHIPKHGFYADGLPADLSWDRRWRSALLEVSLRARLSLAGFLRGLQATGVVGVGRLYASVIRRTGEIEHLGLISTKVVTDAGVAYIVDDWDGGANTIDLLNFHGCGTGTNAENASDTALQTESTTALNPDSTRATGTKSQPSANIARTVGTLTFDASAAVTEHGIFSQAATGGGTLLDRSVFSAINVASGDSIQFTYSLTFSSGG
jgi:hypothetical protein